MPKTLALTKIKYAAFASQETSCYQAVLTVDGKPFAHVENDGHGGCDMQHPIAPFTYKDVEALNAEIKATYPKIVTDMELHGKPFEYEQTLESVCGDLLNKHLVERDFQKALQTKLLAKRPDGKVVAWSIKQRGKMPAPPSAIAKLKADNKAKGYVFLDEMPRDEALAIYAAH